MLSRTEQDVLRSFAVDAKRIAGDQLVELLLFGSRARGEGSESSDLDVLVRVRGLTRELRRSLQDAAHDATEGLSFFLNPCIVREEDWPASSTALATEIAVDGRRFDQVVSP